MLISSKNKLPVSKIYYQFHKIPRLFHKTTQIIQKIHLNGSLYDLKILLLVRKMK